MIFEGLQDDVRLAWRGMRRAKGFSAAAILTLAMGIAGSTVMLALVQGVLLRQLPVRDEDEILVAWKELKASGYAHYPFGDDEIKDLESAGCYRTRAPPLTTCATRRISRMLVSGSPSTTMMSAILPGAIEPI